MNRMMTLGSFLPTEVYPLLLVGVGIATMLGARKIAAGLMGTVLAGIFLPVLLTPLLAMLPAWALVAACGVALILMLGAALEFLIGKDAAAHAKGALAADAIRFVVCLPFRILRWIVSWILRN